MLWSEKYVTGNMKIDAQHKRLFDCIDRLDSSSNMPKSSFTRTLSYLTSYTLSHFSYEEALMKSSNCPNTDEHKKQHKKFEEVISRLNTEAKTLPDPVPKAKVAELSKYLNNWLSSHILKEDMKNSKYFK